MNVYFQVCPLLKNCLVFCFNLKLVKVVIHENKKDNDTWFQGTSAALMSHVTITKSQISNIYQSSESVTAATKKLEFSQKHNVDLGFINLSRYGCYEKLLRTTALALSCFFFSSLKSLHPLFFMLSPNNSL